MKTVLLCLLLCLVCLYGYASHQEHKPIPSDTTTVEKTINTWVDYLNKRKFSEDTEKLKEDVKEFGDKTKKSIEKNTPKVKELFKEIGDYLKR